LETVAVPLPSARARRSAAGLIGALSLCLSAASAPAQEPIRIQVVGGLASLTQFERLEGPFWREEVERLTNGRVSGSIRPFDRSGLRGQDMLRLVSLGVVPFGTALVSNAQEEEPILGAIDLPGLSPDLPSLRRTVDAFRPRLAGLLRQRYGVELLAVYSYPAQVIFCTQAFAGLDDLRGRRVRVSSVSQAGMLRALGAAPVVIPFNQVVASVTNGVVDCAVTGTLSGNEIGLSRVTTHVHAMAVNWGLSLFLANAAAWAGLPEDVRAALRSGVAGLEGRIWEMADRETVRGLACNIGAESCGEGRRDRMVLVPLRPDDDARRRRLLVEAVLPDWIQRCGPDCATAWNETIAPANGVTASAE
jgi:TRAP-type C4-dicarboxylate transport system substrate-binding protein